MRNFKARASGSLSMFPAGVIWILLAVLLGCNREPPPVDTGAKDAVKGFYAAILHKDWPRAYAALHPDSQKKWSQKQFTHLADAYRNNLGFEPLEVKIRTCEEQGTDAIAHIVWTGDPAIHKQRAKDAVTLRRDGDSWRIVPPPNFGHKQT